MAVNNSKDKSQYKQETRKDEATNPDHQNKGKLAVPNQEATDKNKPGAPAWNDESPDTEFNDPRKSET